MVCVCVAGEGVPRPLRKGHRGQARGRHVQVWCHPRPGNH